MDLRIAILKRLHAKWTRDFYAAVGVNPGVALATAQALDNLEHYIDRLENGPRPGRPASIAARMESRWYATASGTPFWLHRSVGGQF